ncbi:hypothetical protein ACKVMT_06895 [Halobacteriales archaeon Cl-PHB]
MEIPDLVRNALGGEEVQAGVNLGDEDALVLTPTRTILYRGEGLLSDESLEEYAHDVERLAVKDGRRKTKFSLTYVDGTETFTVPGNRAETVLEHLIDGILTVGEVIDAEESVRGVYRFSELTLIVTDGRLVKHVGAPVWDADFEEFPFADVTGLAFEQGSVATQIVLSVAGRPQRIKAPNDQAPMVQETLQGALFAYHDVDSLEALNEAVADESAGRDGADADESGVDLSLSEGIDPLVGGSESDDGDAETDDERSPTIDESLAAETAQDAGSETTAQHSAGGTRSTEDTSPAESASEPDVGGEVRDVPDAATAEDVEAIATQVADLTAAVTRQNKLLKQQQQTMEQLIEELRRGR